MKSFLKIIFILLAIFRTNFSEAKVFVFYSIFSEIKITIDNIENKTKSKLILENDVGISCKIGRDLIS